MVASPASPTSFVSSTVTEGSRRRRHDRYLTSLDIFDTAKRKMSPKVKLTYFEIRGRAELVRLILKAGGVEFEDKRISQENWPAIKASENSQKKPTSIICSHCYY